MISGATSCCGCCTARGCRSRSGWRRRWRRPSSAPRRGCWRPGAAASRMRWSCGWRISCWPCPHCRCWCCWPRRTRRASACRRAARPPAMCCASSPSSRSSAGSAWRASHGRRRWPPSRATMCAPRGRWARARRASCSAMSCRRWPPPVAVATALAVAGAILAESTLSFLGLGISPPAPSWGNMLANAQELVFSAPWAAVWPGLAIMVTVGGLHAGCRWRAAARRRRMMGREMARALVRGPPAPLWHAA